MSEERLVKVLKAAAKGQENIRSGLRAFAVHTKSGMAVIWVSRDCEVPVTIGYNSDPDLLRDYPEWAPFDPNFGFARAHPRMRVVHDLAFLTTRDMARSPYYAWQERFRDEGP